MSLFLNVVFKGVKCPETEQMTGLQPREVLSVDVTFENRIKRIRSQPGKTLALCKMLRMKPTEAQSAHHEIAGLVYYL